MWMWSLVKLGGTRAERKLFFRLGREKRELERQGFQPEPRLIASNDPREIGQLAAPEQRDVLARGVIYHGKTQDSVMVTMPLHDANGETVAAVRVVMRSFFGQTEKNAIGRALPIIKRMEARVKSAADLLQ